MRLEEIDRAYKDEGKRALLKRLKEFQKRFKEVECEEIERTTNIAHNACTMTMREYSGNKYLNGIIEKFHEIYRNPYLSKTKSKQKVK